MTEVQAFGTIKSIYEALPAKEICWIAGGAMRSHLLGERVKDYDIFSKTPELIVSEFLKDESYSKGIENDFFANFYKEKKCFQIIKKYAFGSQKETIENFDFTIICASFGKEGFVFDERFFIDNAQKRLVVKSLPKPLSTMKRAIKYSKRGYTMCPVGLGKIVRAINELEIDWKNPDQNQIDFYPDGAPTFRGLD